MEYLITQFHSRRGMIPKVKNGLDITNVDLIKLLKAFRMLNEFQQETTNYWIRYPERYLDEILESTLNLFCIHEPGGQVGIPSQLTPIHFIALIDPKAQWFIKWMHGNYSRMKLLKKLEKYRPIRENYRSIVENAVRHCLEFSANRKVPFDLLNDISDNLSKTSISGNKRTLYAGAELEYAYFIHSVFLLGRIFCFVNGRKFFPIKLRDTDEPVSITKLLVSIILVVVDPFGSFLPPKSPSLLYEPANVVTEVLKSLCSSEQACEICLYKDEITNTLLSPVSQFLDTSEHLPPAEKTLLHVADIVSMIASSTKGRRHLMYGEKKDLFTRTKSSAAHIIAKFTKKALLGELPREAGPGPSHAVIGAYLYICRQLYNTCEGLLVLYPYDLHSVVAEAWREAHREVEAAHTPTPSDNDSSSDSSNITTQRGSSYDIIAWEDTLRDNLLNFASTAKGILLLQQTGAMNECMYYMHARYEKKLQVSKCEKFGYGYMVTQVAATAPGMVALQKTGYISSLIAELWTALECGSSDVPLLTPKIYPVDAVDRTSHKHLVRLLNILSAFAAVYEMLAAKPIIPKASYSFREIPDTIAGFLDRLVLVNTDEKIHSLFNYEQSHIFGLRVLSVMISCLDTHLLLQSQYKYQDMLLATQAENSVKDKEAEDIIIDMLSVERNHILVRSYLIGGPSERILPPRHLNQSVKDGVYPCPMFSSYPVPREFTPNLGGRTAMKQDNELVKFLTNKKPEKREALVG
ncbi:hypothetical protein KUTeg_019629 [Tegillarca granosa]|uniref:Protein broad-minded n=1 Tax=Tegillarca granosa TaxID=220873 RepID=A0ABQ9ED65_TEGGR|nr:hypothetical protein KUTeg_019629 [Tegillarca granosa]